MDSGSLGVLTPDNVQNVPTRVRGPCSKGLTDIHQYGVMPAYPGVMTTRATLAGVRQRLLHPAAVTAHRVRVISALLSREGLAHKLDHVHTVSPREDRTSQSGGGHTRPAKELESFASHSRIPLLLPIPL